MGFLNLLLVFFFSVPSALYAQDKAADESQLLHMHAEVIRAHLEGNVELWMSLESVEYVSVNGGEVTFPSVGGRREQRTAYLRGASFSIYRDLRNPIVEISEDGSLGWLIVEVEIEGTTTAEDGGQNVFHDIWAWIELYEKTDEGWLMTGNVSNRR